MIRESRNLREVSRLDTDQCIQCQQPCVDEGIGLLLLDSGNGGQRLDGSGNLFLEPDADLLLGVDVDLPPGEDAREPGVLAAAADGQRELIGVNKDVRPFFVVIDLEPLELRRGEGVGHVRLDVGIPADDVDFLVVEFPNDVFHPLAAKANAGTDGIHFFISRVHSELGSETGFAGDSLDLDRAVVDLGDLQLKQLEHKVGVPSGEDDLGMAVRALYGFHKATDAFAPLVFLGGHTLAVGQQGLEFA